ncbi:MAG: FTR1 family iron permease [Clostridiales bacterium]|nr:FTR1 family iron permease [Clostridiales bacterium]
MKSLVRISVLIIALMLVVSCSAYADAPFEYEEGNRWGSSADRIDRYLDEAFEAYLAGDNSAAYDCVNNAYFKVYEVTGFERQTMTYVSGPRKNAVELEFTTCKAAVKKTELDETTKSAVKGELNKLKTMIREDANKLALKDGEAQTSMTWWQNGVQLSYDPWSQYGGEAEGSRYASWTEAFEAINDLMTTVDKEYSGKTFTDAAETLNNAYFSIYLSSGFAGRIYDAFGYDSWRSVEDGFTALHDLISSEKLQKTSYGNTERKLLNGLKKRAQRLDDISAVEAAEAGKSYDNWSDAADGIARMSGIALNAVSSNDVDKLLSRSLNAAYRNIWLDAGVRDRVSADVGAGSAEKVDSAFEEALKLAVPADDGSIDLTAVKEPLSGTLAGINTDVKALTEQLKQVDDAAQEKNANWLTALGSFGIIVREGLEAILVIAAIIAYLVKSGNGKALKQVYIGAIAGIVASFIAAAALYFLKKAFSQAGMAQEIIEGVTALIAVCVLFYVSNWMISKSEAAAWTGYIHDKVRSGVEKRSAFTLAFTAFLSVFREGAEVVLFYQPMMSGEEGSVGMVLAGFAVGCVVLVGVYLAITKLSIKLPIKLFFTATSILMAVMCVAFLGSGIKELSEGGLFECTLRVTGIPENDVVQVLGIYPFLETLAPQLILAVILLITFMIAHYRQKIAVLKKQIGPAEAK